MWNIQQSFHIQGRLRGAWICYKVAGYAHADALYHPRDRSVHVGLSNTGCGERLICYRCIIGSVISFYTSLITLGRPFVGFEAKQATSRNSHMHKKHTYTHKDRGKHKMPCLHVCRQHIHAHTAFSTLSCDEIEVKAGNHVFKLY